MGSIREYYRDGNEQEILEIAAGKALGDFEDENDVYRIGRAYQKSGQLAESKKWFREYVERNQEALAYRRLLEVSLQLGEREETRKILAEMEGKGFLSDYYYAAKYELAKAENADTETIKSILTDMIRENKIPHYMIELAILYIREKQPKEAAKPLKKVCHLFEGEDSADYATELLEAIENGSEEGFIKDNPYTEAGLFGRVEVAGTETPPIPPKEVIDKKVEPEKGKEPESMEGEEGQQADSSFIYAKDKEGKAKERKKEINLCEVLHLQEREKEKQKKEEPEVIPACVSKGMAGVVGFKPLQDTLVDFYQYWQFENTSHRKSGQQGMLSCNFSVKGESGLGSSRAVGVIADVLKGMGLVNSSEVQTVTYDDIVAHSSDETFQNIQDLFQNSAGKVIHIDHLEDFYSEGVSMGMEAIGYLEKAIKQSKGLQVAVVVTGAGDNYDKLFKVKKQFAKLFKTNNVVLEKFTAEELREILNEIAYQAGFVIWEKHKGKLLNVIKAKMKEADFEYINTLQEMLEEAKLNLIKRCSKKKIKKDEDYTILWEQDFMNEGKNSGDEVEKWIAELDGMVGLSEVKNKVKEIVSMVSMKAEEKEMAEKLGLPYTSDFGNLNLVFVGNPGTGKTTVARIIAGIYRYLGVLSKGHLVEVKRADLVAEHVGGTPKLTNAKLDEALGGVLFIDEAYDLWHGPSDSFGQESINTLVEGIEKNRNNLMVIMAGYEKEMDDMIQNANPGLPSRMQTKVHFADYTPMEMVDIFKKMLNKQNRQLKIGLDQKLENLLEIKSKEPNFGNARGVRNLVDIVIRMQAVRLQDMKIKVYSDMILITEQDLDIPSEREIPKPKGVDELLQELDQLTGLQGVKKEVHALVKRQRANERRKSSNLVSSGVGSLHMVFQGAPGTGKTSVARILGEIYRGLGLLQGGQLVEKQAGDLLGTHVGEAAELTNKAIQDAKGGILFIDEAYALMSEGNKAYGQSVVDTLLKGMEDQRDSLMVIVAGYKDKMDEFLTSNDGLKSRFVSRIDFEDYTPDEMVEIFKKNVKKSGFLLGKGVEREIKNYFKQVGQTDGFGNARGVRNTLEKLCKIHDESISDRLDEISDEEMQTLTIKDVKQLTDGMVSEAEEEKTVQELLDELNNLVGLSNVKRQVNELIQLQEFNQRRLAEGLPAVDAGFLHMVFTGSAGTGKTTVARIIGRIYKGLGLLSKGQTVETEYKDLVAEYTGQTAPKTDKKIKEALGGILFIDEAYTLADTGRGEFGKEAIDSLLKAMAEKKDFMVIVAGYPQPMQNFLDSNEGLNSRFSNKIVFEDYSLDEMLTIFKMKMKKDGMQMDEETEKVAFLCIRKKSREKNFGNARGVGNIYNDIKKKMALRIGKIKDPTKDDLCRLVKEDFYALDPELKQG